MQAGRRYKLKHLLRWTRKYILLFALWATVPVIIREHLGIDWMYVPWQPISLIGIAVAFYLGFKNNSSYDRMWEARKIWGGIVNTSRSFTVMAKHYVNNDETGTAPQSEEVLKEATKRLVHRHVAWLYALTIQMRKLKPWEHSSKHENAMRKQLGMDYKLENFDQLDAYLSKEDKAYIMTKGNQSSHLLSLQTADLMRLRREGVIEHFRHLEMQGLITELYSLQGKSERIKNFPFPRQYATVNYYFVVLFILLLPFGMIDVFSSMDGLYWNWFSIIFTTACAWVFWCMEMIGDYSENPFEGLYNDVPITSMARGIEIDIRQMLDETNLPAPIVADDDMGLLF